jgi:hypothetical protein
MELSQKHKMLAAALYMHKAKKETAIYIMMLLDREQDIDDMTWYMSEHPNASDDELIAVARQLDKEYKESKKD